MPLKNDEGETIMSDVLEKEEQQVAAPAAEPQEAPAGK